MSEPEIWVVVASRGGGTEPPYDKPIVMETNVEGATRESAQERAGAMERNKGSFAFSGPCRIARLVFEDTQPPKDPSK